MQNEWLYIGVFLLLAPVFPGLALIIPRLIAPRKPNPIKSDTYECGLETVGDTYVRIKIQSYIFALGCCMPGAKGCWSGPKAARSGSSRLMELSLSLFFAGDALETIERFGQFSQ
jgi:NADH-quinone oxidoreductase subunit A